MLQNQQTASLNINTNGYDRNSYGKKNLYSQSTTSAQAQMMNMRNRSSGPRMIDNTMHQFRAETSIKGNNNMSQGNLAMNTFQGRSSTHYGGSKTNSNGFKKWTNANTTNS